MTSVDVGTTFALVLGLLLVGGAVFILRRASRAARITARLFAEDHDGGAGRERSEVSSERASDGPLAMWLTRAGHRGPRAQRTFLLSLLGCAALALLFAWGTRASGITAQLSALFAGLPVVGPGFASLIAAGPWVMALALAALPVLLVQRDRARRVEAIEQDLPLVLELLATLAEAGFGFESAVGEVIRAQASGRPLADELRLYQLEVSTGARRAESLAHLAARVDLPAVRSFAAALIHGEDTGASIAGLLRPQARLVRQRRRERALAAAEALPEKLVVPLLIGFLPGLLVWTLGPAFFQLFEMIDAAFG